MLHATLFYLYNRCRVPECDTQNATVSIPTWWPPSEDAKCYRPVFNVTEPNTTCSNEEEVAFVECDEWIYENRNSVISEVIKELVK